MRVIDYFDRGAQRHSDRTFLIAEDQRWSYEEARAESVRFAAALQAGGLQVGERVGVLAPNTPEAMIAMLGLWRAGGTWVPLNSRNAVQANIDFMNEVGCSWLFMHSSFASDAELIAKSVPSLTRLICLDQPYSEGEPITRFLASGEGTVVADWSDPFGAPEHQCAAWPTGGTTGASKAVIWTNQVWETLTELSARTWPQVDHPVNLMVAPVTHAAGVMAMIFASLGATVVIRPGFDAADVLDQIERHGVTHMFLPPTAYYGLLAEQEANPRDVTSLELMLLAAAPVSPDKLARGVATFGSCIGQCWGQAEAPFLLTYLAPEEVAAAAAGDHPERLRSCGRPTSSALVEILDDEGVLLPRGERGELVARGRLVTPGYFQRPEATAEVRQFGWHHTGDVGYMYEDDYVYIVDRKKEMVITGGFNVYPAEVEAVLLAMPEIRDCAVIGIPDEKWGESVLALVIAEEPDWSDATHVLSCARTALGPVKAPKRVVFVSYLPRTPVGKTDRRALRNDYWKGFDRAVN